MSRHEGVSCDSCLKGNFRGRRYKCLVCYDYDLCANCYEAGANTTRHLVDHPMQCILTRSDFELYYGGEGVSIEQPQSLTCPYCTRMGFTEATLQEHVAADHPDTSFEVVCPVCASLPGGDPNHVTDDFAGHLTLEHRSGPRDLISFLDEPASSRHNVRRMPHPSRGVGAPRARRSNMHFSSSGALSPSSREGIDPITELLSQLSGVRRTGAGTGQGSSAPSQLQQLQMQLQLERQQVRAARQQLERLPRRQPQVIGTVSGGVASSGHSATMASVVTNSSASNNNAAVNANNAANPSNPSSLNSQNSMFLLPRCMTNTLSDSQLQIIERESANRSLFTREIVVSTLSQALPELIQQSAVQTPGSTATTTPETPSGVVALVPAKKSNSNQEVKRDQTTTNKYVVQQNPQQQQSHQTLQTGAAATGSQSQAATTVGPTNQGLPPNPNAVSAQNTPIVQTLMHSVLPQPLVLQQPLSPAPVRNTGTGTIREPVAAPAPAYMRGGVGPVSVTGPSRRKPVRAVDGRNQSTEPPPPH
ncbi:E3 ubiquitin-protein ligase KCMF1-like [Neodiprion virginianus]|uniref:E3 ubiquitin-protein ligase KCMF1-like n=1 Tax=Neodiprion fabricii TaxID=2872261 RepID=UPI001ED91353|nr:E3 ubiquitin-protein ligase KCMF1-like [Neodiprion fabricii]XP_046611143.1 E3 ubiquitin-protein ligase KCMF1-like [Neodiprion virginianus]